MSSLAEKLRKNSTIKDTDILEHSKFFTKKDMIQTSIPILNIALSGRLDGGLTPGLTMFAGPSKHFKTAFLLLTMKAYLERYPDSVALFYDSEFGTPQSYFQSFGIPLDRVIHTPITDIEQLKFDCMQQLSNIERSERVFVGIDSIGNLASKKEVDDALEGKSVADMSRAKQLKSFFRMVTPHLTIRDIPMVVVNHTYKEIGLYPKDIVGGGTGSYYSADNIFIIGRQQEKEGNEISGYNFVIKVEKSRYVKEGSKIPVTVSFKNGISKWSGLLDLATEAGMVQKVRKRSYVYNRIDPETGVIEDIDFTEAQTETSDFMSNIVNHAKFKEFVEKKYMLSYNNILRDEDNAEVFDALEEDDV